MNPTSRLHRTQGPPESPRNSEDVRRGRAVDEALKYLEVLDAIVLTLPGKVAMPFAMPEFMEEYMTKTGRVEPEATEAFRRHFDLTGKTSPDRLRIAIKDLRRELGDDARSPRYFVTVPRVGCRMPDPDDV